MKKTPYIVKVYFLLAAFCIALPTLGTQFYPSQKGRFLVASEKIRYEPFRESVIYISHHDLFGAFGLVINKPIDIEKLREVDKNLPEDLPPLRLGGPVGFPDHSFALFANHPQEPVEEHPRGQSYSLEDVIKKVDRYPHKQVFIAYSGWGPLQLDMEIIRGSWTVIDAPKEIVFEETDTVDLWRRLKEQRTPDRYSDQKI